MDNLVKKFYIEIHLFHNSVDFAIVYGTVGKKQFTVKRRENIIGASYDTNIPITSGYLFDDWKTAAEIFLKIAKKIRGETMRDIKELEQDTKKVEGLLRLAKDKPKP